MIRLLRMIGGGGRREWVGLVVLSVLSAISTTAILGVVNAAAQKASKDGVSIPLAIAFAAALLLFVAGQRRLASLSGKRVERAVHRLRTDLGDRIRKAQWSSLDETGRVPLYAALTQDAQTISSAAPMLISSYQGAVMIFFAGLYLAWLSQIAFALAALFCLIAFVVHHRLVKDLMVDAERARAAQDDYAATLEDLIGGIKEVRQNAGRAADLFAHLADEAQGASRAEIRAHRRRAVESAAIQTIFYVLIGLMVFAVPLFTTGYHDVVVQATTAVLFLIGPITSLVQSLPMLGEAGLALRRMRRTYRQLAGSLGDIDERAQSLDAPIARLQLSRVRFAYAGSGFQVGPLSLSLKDGETVFITGGNGSGKTTLFNLICGLEPPQSGRIRVNGKVLKPEQTQAFRDRIATVFSDHHLFRTLYGMDIAEQARTTAVLDRLEMSPAVTVDDGALTTVDLSAGQRRRAALAAALGPEADILMLDEWAANQDPRFRALFYETILPELKQRYRMVILITHDDRWFHLADRVLHMEDGRLR